MQRLQYTVLTGVLPQSCSSVKGDPMTTILRRLALPVGAALIISACAPAPAPPAAAPEPAVPGPQLADNQRLVIGAVGLAPTMDPQITFTGSVRRYEIF